MAIVTGDRYLEYLVRFAERNAGPLLEGALTLKLNPVGLHYVHTRLDALRELEGLLAGAPVDYLRAYVSDLGDHRALEQLRRILGPLTSLKVISVLPPPYRDPTPLSLLPFGRLKVLELRGCDLSTSAAKGLLELRHTLEKLVCRNSTDALRHVFASRIVDIKDSPVWSKLTFVSCACNGLVLMDESLQLLPVVETLDLSQNRFGKLDNLRKCTKLRYLDLGFNHLRSIAPLSEVPCQLVKLVLRNNALTSLRGIENLKSLEGLDLSYNIISSFTDLEILTSLSSLHNLWLEGNPICCSRWYRAHVFSFFSNPEKLKLDEKGISTREYWERHVIFASKQKSPAGYGFYFPAKEAAEDENSTSTKKKKYSRLASIEDGEQTKFICSDQESVSCDSDSLRQEELISDNESRIAGLINRAKYMKNDQSVIWLQEFKEHMDQTLEEIEVKSHLKELSLTRRNIKQRKGRKPSGCSSRYVTDLAETSEGGTSSSIFESDMSFKDTYICDRCSNGTEMMEPSVVNGGNVSLIETNSGLNSEQDKLKFNSLEPLGISSLEVDLHSSHSYSTAGGHEVEDINSLAPLTAIDEIIGSRPSSVYPGSPPHYREDILHRRLYLEEEFLQKSADSLSVASYDSDTTCSGGASCELNSSNSDLDSLLIQASVKQGFSDNSQASLTMEYVDRRHDKASLRENNIIVSDDSIGQESNTAINILTNDDKPFFTRGISDNGDYGFEHIAWQEVGGIEKQRGKGKLKRRFISLSEVLNTEPLFDKPNGTLKVSETDLNDTHGPRNNTCEEAAIHPRQSYHNNHSSIAGTCNSFTKAETSSLDPAQHEYIMDFFNLKVTDFSASETFEEVVRCDCIFQLGTVFQESEVAILRSCENKLYILLIDATPGGRDVISKVLGCHRLEDVREVVVGLGQQALRIYLEGSTTYLLLTRSSEKSKNLLSLLRLCDSAAFNNLCSLKSWEQVQVKLLEKYVCGILKTGIFLYSTLLFWHDNSEGESWFTRSIFVVEGYVLVCIENFVQFGSSMDDCGSTCPYYFLDSCCAIQDILEVVIEPSGSRCLTLTLANAMSGINCFTDKNEKKKHPAETSKVSTWKLKWYLQDTLLNFITLLKAIHLGLMASPLPVKCIP